MAKTGKKFLFYLLFGLCALAFVPGWLVSAQANIEVSATVDRNELSIADTLTYNVKISSDRSVGANEPELPSLDGFDLLNKWSSMEARAQFVSKPNGEQEMRTIRTQVYSFMLQPKRIGAIKIGVAYVEVEGKKYQTKPISITVRKGPPSNPNAGGRQNLAGGDEGEDDEDLLFNQLLRRRGGLFAPPSGLGRSRNLNINDAFSLQAVADKSKVFANEQITVSWYLVTTGLVRDLDTLKYPDLKGFWKEDIEVATNLNYQDDVINGIAVKKALLATSALFALKPGSFAIDPYRAKASVIVGGGAFGAFGFGQPVTLTKSSREVKIEVLPLPTEGKPENFTGAVGQFEVSAKAAGAGFKVNQPVEFKIRIEGRGNAKLIDLPAIQLPPALELYEQKSESKFFAGGTSFKEFKLLIIPRQAGVFTIPQISFGVFDPQTKRYMVKSTEPYTLQVAPGEPGTGVDTAPSPGATPSTKPSPQEPKSWEPPLNLRFDPGSSLGSEAKRNFWLLVFAAIALALMVQAWREFGWSQSASSQIAKRLRPRLRRMNSLVDKTKWRAVGVEGTNTIYFALGQLSGQGGANADLEKMWREVTPTARAELEAPVTRLLEQFQQLSFAPEAMVVELRRPEKMRELVRELEHCLQKGGLL